MALFTEIGVNTDELNKSELQRIVDNNKELQDNSVTNIEHDSRVNLTTQKNEMIIEEKSVSEENKSKEIIDSKAIDEMINTLYEKE